MYVNIKNLELIHFNSCKDCVECCKSKYLAPLVLEDFEKVYNYFPILIAKLDVFKPVMLLSNGVCPYLKDDKCSIYENRPPACKIYPYSPWYDDILLDISCKGIGIKGELLPLSKEEFYKSPFFDERVDNISEKLKNSLKWLEGKEVEYIGSLENISLYKLKDISDYFDSLHFKSLKFLRNYQNILKP